MQIGKIGRKKFTTNEIKFEGTDNFNLDSSVKTATLTTLAGYLEKNEIEVSGREFYSSSNLSSFLSYVLNDKRAAPRKFNLNFRFSGQKNSNQVEDKNNLDCLVSFSGGIDSTAGLLYSLDHGFTVKPLWINFGQKNKKEEIKKINNICEKLGIKFGIVKVDLGNYVDKGWSRWKNGIIPARNYLFASIAGEIVSRSHKKKPKVLVCAHKEEITPVNTDKSRRFYNTCSSIFSTAYDKKIEVTTPFFDLTKPEIVSYWKRNWTKKFKLSPQDTISCYYGNHCGNCKACINRAVAFTCAGENLENFIDHPFADKELTIYNGYIGRFDDLEMKRQIDFIYSLDKYSNQLPTKLQEFVRQKYPQYKSKIKDRLKEIKSSDI